MLSGTQRTQQQQLKSLVLRSDNVVFFGGAGVSTESGIPDFRSAEGLWNQNYLYPPEQVVSHSFFAKDPKAFYDFYRDKMLHLEAKPNAAHLKLAELEQQGHVRAVITQNIDGLHQAAGSENVIELHGSVQRNHCLNCNESYDAEFIANSFGVPRCTACGGIVKPDVVLYEEPLDAQVMQNAVDAISAAEVLIVAGTSLAVYPAAGFLQAFHGSHLVVVNLSPTSVDKNASLLIDAKVGEIFAWD